MPFIYGHPIIFKACLSTARRLSDLTSTKCLSFPPQIMEYDTTLASKHVIDWDYKGFCHSFAMKFGL